MKRDSAEWSAWAAVVLAAAGAAGAEVSFTSPGFPPSSLDADGRLATGWGVVALRLDGPGLSTGMAATVRSETLDDSVPAARAERDFGPARLIVTAYRSPVWPSGVDVLVARIEEMAGREQPLSLALTLPDGARLGARTVRMKGRPVLVLPADAPVARTRRDWGWDDDGTSLPGWGKPATDCDPAFRSIRAGMGGVPLRYRFRVPNSLAAHVVLGFCESHYAEAGRRPLVCRVEGAPLQTVDPVGRWGRNQPGALAFDGRDENSDGNLDVEVVTPLDAPDRNPILNVVWVFPAGAPPRLDQVIAGRMNAVAIHRVDAGGPGDQSLYEPGEIRFDVKLPAGGARELVFLAACGDAPAPDPAESAWTERTLRAAAASVWRDWPAR